MQWGKKTPGLLVFLIDQSGSMKKMGKHKLVANAVQDAVWECMVSCINGLEVRGRFNLLVIGYSDQAAVLTEKWISDIDLLAQLQKAHNSGTSFIEPKADGATAMADAFQQRIGSTADPS